MKKDRIVLVVGCLLALPCPAQEIFGQRGSLTRAIPLAAPLVQGCAIHASYFDESKNVAFFAARNPGRSSSAILLNANTNEARLLVQADAIQDIFVSPAMEELAVTTWNKDAAGYESRELYVFDYNGNELAQVRHPDNWNFNAIYWSSANQLFYYRDAPDKSNERAGEEFSAVGVLDVKTGRNSWFPLKEWALGFSLNPADQNIYVTESLPTVHGAAVSAYSTEGKYLGAQPNLNGAEFSSQGRYYVPWRHEGAEEWAVYDAKTNKRLLQFNNGKPTEYTYGPRWNPANDDLLLLSKGGQEDSLLGIYSVSKRKVVKVFKGDHSGNWSSRGAYWVGSQCNASKPELTLTPLSQ